MAVLVWRKAVPFPIEEQEVRVFAEAAAPAFEVAAVPWMAEAGLSTAVAAAFRPVFPCRVRWLVLEGGPEVSDLGQEAAEEVLSAEPSFQT